MNILARWARFNLVGLIGVAVQLVALMVLNRLTRGRYLFATAAAVETALLHNFIWHVRYTWRDRPGPSPLRRLVGFQLSNGLVSLAGNLVAMPLLVRSTHLPVLAANFIAILCCSTLNFVLGDNWIFRSPFSSADAGLQSP